MRLRGINDYQAANAYLPEFTRFYNRKFAVLPRSTGDGHLPLDPVIDLDFLFSIQDTRTISKDLLIQIDHVTYQIITNRPSQNLIKREVLVTQDESGFLSAYLNHQKLTLKILNKLPEQIQVVSSKSLDHLPFMYPW